MDCKYDIAVIGAGPGGYVAAIRAAQLKQKVVLIEKERLGGTCMNWGCIPTKFLLHQTQIWNEWKHNASIEGRKDDIFLNWEKVQIDKNKRVDRLVRGIEFLLKKNGVDIVQGEARLKNDKIILILNDDGENELHAEKIILATGSRPVVLPFLKPNGKEVVTSREALDLTSIPNRLLVVGAGAVGLEMATIFQRMGSMVEIVELFPQIIPGSDAEIAKLLERSLKKQKIKIHTSVKIHKHQIEVGINKLEGTGVQNGRPYQFEAEVILSAVGRAPVSEISSELDSTIHTDERGFIQVDSHFRTSIPNIYAIGDLIGGMLLAHKASHEGILAAENAAGAENSREGMVIPAAVFTDPEFASVGLTQEKAAASLDKVKIGHFSLQANGRALTLGSSDGFVKIISDGNDVVVGAHILAPHASEIIPELTCAVSHGMKLKEIGEVIHIHPTISESVIEAVWNSDKRAIHMMNE